VAKRDYGQYCGVAEALDVLGERWTILIVRDLLLGPRRYGEIASQLPSAGTDLVTARLRTLEDHGFVARIETGGVGGGVMYRLTPVGEQLRPLVEELALVGLRLMQSPLETSHQLDLRWALSTVRTLVNAARCPVGTCDIFGTGQAFRMASDGIQVTLRYRSGTDTPANSTITGDDATLLTVLSGHTRLENAPVTFSGRTAEAKRWFAALIAAVPAPIRATT
jgi:DNA-binding HxlR family transcriptional regulator